MSVSRRGSFLLAPCALLAAHCSSLAQQPVPVTLAQVPAQTSTQDRPMRPARYETDTNKVFWSRLDAISRQALAKSKPIQAKIDTVWQTLDQEALLSSKKRAETIKALDELESLSVALDRIQGEYYASLLDHVKTGETLGYAPAALAPERQLISLAPLAAAVQVAERTLIGSVRDLVNFLGAVSAGVTVDANGKRSFKSPADSEKYDYLVTRLASASQQRDAASEQFVMKFEQAATKLGIKLTP